MEISQIKVPPDVIDILVSKFFTEPIINKERFALRVENSIKNNPWDSRLLPDIEIDVSNIEIPIDETVFQSYFNQLLESENYINNSYPYISLISDNCENELKVYITETNGEGKVYGDQLRSKSHFYSYDDNTKKYTFL